LRTRAANIVFTTSLDASSTISAIYTIHTARTGSTTARTACTARTARTGSTTPRTSIGSKCARTTAYRLVRMMPFVKVVLPQQRQRSIRCDHLHLRLFRQYHPPPFIAEFIVLAASAHGYQILRTGL
jgi:hypothetical protein